ncbi:MAG: hypothetical protein ACOCWL_02780 [Thermoguttaceae bacterium]
MSAPETSEGRLEDQRLDRLVDGELPETERHELLADLDRQPDGWRRCALAFLEAQCWRQELRGWVDARQSPPSATAETSEEARRPAGRLGNRKVSARTSTALAMAASFLVALWLAWSVQDAFEVGRAPRPGPGVVAQSMPGPETPAPAAPEAPAPPQPQRAVAARGPWQMVTLSADGPDGQKSQTIDLPACDRKHLDSRWPETLPSALPPEVLEALQRSGYRVRQHRELMPIEMQDGRRLVVPVEQVELEYVGQPSL